MLIKRRIKQNSYQVEFFIFILMMNPQQQREVMKALVTTRMPYGKYKNRFICDLPEPYLSWYHAKGFPKGKIGMLLHTIYEIKLNGLEHLLKPLRQ